MFNKQNFCHVASNNRNEQKAGLFVYKTTDNLATVSASGYFNEKIIDINLHDLIIHEQYDHNDKTKVQRNILCVTERTLENVGTTVIKSKWEGDIDEAIAQINVDLSGKVNIDGTSIMTAPLKFISGSMRGAIGPYLNGLGFWKMDSEGNLTQIATLSDTQFVPTTNNALSLGTATRKLSKVFTGVLNNGYDIAVPVTAQADTLALKSEVDLAANSGRMITDQGVWYAKTESATTPPASAEVEGRNYADFTQTDQHGDPIIVIYTYTSGAWTQTETITPPNYDGYVPITSKIWDIPEQTGQEGGRILWNHQSKEFTPYPLIVSYQDVNITGNSTVAMPVNPGSTQIVNKDYVDTLVAAISGFDLFDTKWRDATTSNTAWALSDGNWKTNANGYNHLAAEYNPEVLYAWYSSGYNLTFYTKTETPDQTTTLYDVDGVALTGTASITQVGEGYITVNTTIGGQSTFVRCDRTSASDTPILETETIGATTISYYTAPDGHKIILPDQETNADAIYTATGIAWYYILDTANQRFKLPRTKFAFTGVRDTVGNYVAPGLPNITGNFGAHNYNTTSGAFAMTGGNHYADTGGSALGQGSFDASRSSAIYGNSSTVQAPATQMYLYFYMGVEL